MSFSKKRIAIFASGSGSNAETITRYFEKKDNVIVSLFLTNNAEAGVIKRGKRLGIPTVVFSKKNFSERNDVVKILENLHIDFVVLAGFLWLIPESLIKAYPNKIINIHPALLPKYGGKGMWGHFVHEAVVENKEKESGITIHFVNEHYDEGEVIFQASCEVTSSDTPEDVARKVQVLEHEHFPRIVEEILQKL
ncbi:phosphoribosylglycinamide formyltransferase [Jiulongibacter sediminis]|uniref:Phosphoribosylglycinamide formyltransferase n=1 Tax=Jiulongibacter sediminis TaxID=1605367 RepID=A0A0P7CB32_9BACT|nr:phosphoribosylglycinamide formyltransferase [Jiulongibacter sediminis]KPM49967.1 phosphoribosylglycinamide formyltransferase [Jiulongibacter sediminis]TBX27000.1 phosphoribosylglycinamide formyltransferase [Jiulongibacter sediminis]